MNAPRSGPIGPAGTGPGTLIDITPESAGWSNVAFAVVAISRRIWASRAASNGSGAGTASRRAAMASATAAKTGPGSGFSSITSRHQLSPSS